MTKQDAREQTGKLIQDLFEIWRGTQNVRQEIVYHYTDANGLLGILGSGELWATGIAYFNDPHELTHGRSFYKEILQSRLKEPSCPLHDIIHCALEAMAQNEDKFFGYADQMAACLSTEGDLLSQWRAYANGGNGFSIGFDGARGLEILKSQIEDLQKNQFSAIGGRPNFWPLKIMYNEEEKRQLSARFVDCVHKGYASLITDGSNHADAYRICGTALAMAIPLAAMASKSEGFEEEREVRLTIVNLVNLKLAGIRVDVSARCMNDGRFATYREIGLQDDRGLLPIKEIVVGPALDFHRTSHGLKAYLRSLKYSEESGTMPQIVPSKMRLSA